MDNRPIGIFDSGVGGLTVLKELKKIFPNETFIYYGDTARVPYGTKSPETVTRFAIQIINFLLKKDVKLIIVACNTVSSNSIPTLKSLFPVPIIGVIEPGVELALQKTRNNKVGIIGTPATIKSHKYKKLLLKRNKRLKLFEKACPLFVPLVEEGWLDSKITYNVIKEYLSDMKKEGIDTLILGCTHYPMLSPLLQKFMPDVNLINSGYSVALKIKNLLDKHNLFTSNKKVANDEYYVSDLSPNFINIAQMILEKKIKKVKVYPFE